MEKLFALYICGSLILQLGNMTMVLKKELDYSINQKIVKIEDASYVPVIDRAKKNLKTEVRSLITLF